MISLEPAADGQKAQNPTQTQVDWGGPAWVYSAGLGQVPLGGT